MVLNGDLRMFLSVGRENGPERGLENISECRQRKWS